MPRVRWLLLVLAATVIGSASGGASTPPAAIFPRSHEPLDDPFPIRRYRVTEAQFADAIKSLDAGAMVRMPRADFESRVQKAAATAARPVPRITDATFTATLAGTDLTGTAEFTVENACSRPVALPFDAFKPALRSATWADGREAVVGNLGGGPAVWVEKSGTDSLRAKWSLLGTPDGGGQRYELRVPPTPGALLTLELPADQTPAVANDDALLTGPFPIDGGRREWRLRFGGRSRLEFTVRGPTPPDAGFAETALAARYDVTPEHLTCSFEYDLEPSRGPVGEWAFALDAGLQVTDVVVNNRAGWRIEPGKTPADPRKLRVTLRQPGAGGKLVISAVAPLADAPLPVARPLNAVVQAERVEIRLHPDLQPRAWSPGDYRLTNTLVGTDQSRTLLLVGTLLPAGSDAAFRRMPTLQTDAADSFSTTETVVWRPGRESSLVSCRVGVRVARGQLFRLAFRAPPGFAPERADPSDLVRHAGPTPSGFAVEFARPLTAGQRVELRFDLRGPGVPGGVVPFPQVSPVGAAQRDGWFSVCPDVSWSAQIQTVPPVPEADDLDLFDAPGDALATYSYRGTAPAGWLTLGSPAHLAPPPRPVQTTVAPVPAGNNDTPPRPSVLAVGDLYHVTAVGERGGAVVAFGGTATGGRECPVSLPAGAVVRAACVGGQWLDPARCRTSDDGVLRLPLPASDDPVRFEVRYRLPVSAGELRSPLPDVPGRTDVRRWWVFDAAVVPVSPVLSRRTVPASDLPTLLGPPLDRDGAVVERFDGDTVTVESRRTATLRGIAFALAVFVLGRRRCGLSLVFAACAGLIVAFGPPAWVLSAWSPLCVALVTALLAFAEGGRPAVVAAVA
ncbi:MAG TPA: hypothetical protein VMZ71_17290, partial [Gemmataceae bacterium]|nr:hypothetical protein [Gemmataceae bacterium]